jgi:hypothetical protein
MVKFKLKEDNNYEKVSDHLVIIVEEVSSVIDLWWEEEVKVNAGM